jgi:hypothetical protein
MQTMNALGIHEEAAEKDADRHTLRQCNAMQTETSLMVGENP